MMTIIHEKILGQGYFGIVFEGLWNKIPVAIKRIPINHVMSSEREEKALKMFNHENVIKLFDVKEDQNFKYFSLELCKATMAQLFVKDDDPKKYNGPMPPTVDVLYQLAIGLEYVHGKGLIHRDLKPENVLIWVSPDNNQVLMKWADFGLSKPVNERGTFTMSEKVKGTYQWLAPELLKILEEQMSNQDNSFSGSGTIILANNRGNIKSDVFAEGLVFGYFLLDGVHLFGPRFQIQINVLKNSPINMEKIQPLCARELIQKMLKEKPQNRITSSEVAKQLKQLKQDMTFTFSAGPYPTIEEIKKLIHNGKNINFENEKGFTPLLHLANKAKISDEKLLEMIQFLIKNGSNVNSKSKVGGRNALHFLCHHYQNENFIKIIQILIQNNIEVNCKTVNGSNALTLLCRNYQKENLIDIVKLLLQNGIEVNCKDKYGENALTLLCQHYQNDNLIEIIEILIQNKIEVDCKTYQGGRNALHILCQYYQKDYLLEIIKNLVQNGINVNCKTNSGQNALHILCQNYQNENLIYIIQFLITKDIDVNCKINDGSNALTLLCKFYRNNNLIEIIRLLIDCNFEVKCSENYGNNVLRLLCQNYKSGNLLQIMQLLIKNGCNVTLETLTFFQEKYQKENRNEILQLLSQNL